jgi:endonuclease YncB( thermonuclease family)
MQNREMLGWLVAAALLVAVVFAYVRPDAGPTISGPVRVIDGDSLHVGETEIRLFGVDAFEGWQVCTRDGSPWRCGEAAADELRALTARAAVSCSEKDKDTYGRTVAVCNNGTVDLSAELARAGLALAYREYSRDYIDEEDEARIARRGAWAGEFGAPWDERRGRKTQVQPQQPQAEEQAETNCRGSGIKGNIRERDGERIYHLPGWNNYEQTDIDEANGERWFCTEEEARRAGWRPPRG